MQRKLRCALFAAGLLGAAASAFAQEEKGRYLGLSVGATRYDALCQGSSGACDSGDTGLRVFGGYQFHRNFAVELGIASLGKAPPDAEIQRTARDVEATASALDFLALGIVPVSERVRLYGKLGIYSALVKTTGTSSIPIIGIPVTVENDQRFHDATFGAGVEFRLTPRFALRGDWQRYNNLGESALDVASIGALYRF
jgi:OOP family OmpA-OmpF porin